MERVSLLLVLSVLDLPSIHAQTQAMAPAFDAASVQVHKAGDAEEPRNGPWIQTSPGGVTMRNAWCLGWAYDQKEWLISGPDLASFPGPPGSMGRDYRALVS